MHLYRDQGAFRTPCCYNGLSLQSENPLFARDQREIHASMCGHSFFVPICSRMTSARWMPAPTCRALTQDNRNCSTWPAAEKLPELSGLLPSCSSAEEFVQIIYICGDEVTPLYSRFPCPCNMLRGRQRCNCSCGSLIPTKLHPPVDRDLLRTGKKVDVEVLGTWSHKSGNNVYTSNISHAAIPKNAYRSRVKHLPRPG